MRRSIQLAGRSILLAGPLALGILVFATGAAGLGTTPPVHAAAARLRIPATAQQLIIVSSPTSDPAAPGYLATLRTYQRSSRQAPWRPVFASTEAETGYGHLRRVRHEGDGSTPIGVFAIGRTMYGNERNPGGLHYRYHRLVCGDWWDEDPHSIRYNRFVHARCGVTPAFASWSEPLWTETVAYPYFAVIQFNTNPIRAGTGAPGSGIFLHSWVGGATDGCVALHTAALLEALRWLRPSMHPAIEIGTPARLDPAVPAG